MSPKQVKNMILYNMSMNQSVIYTESVDWTLDHRLYIYVNGQTLRDVTSDFSTAQNIEKKRGDA